MNDDKPRARYHYGKGCWLEVYDGRVRYRTLVGCVECGCAMFRMRGSGRCMGCQRVYVYLDRQQKRDCLIANGFGPRKKFSYGAPTNYRQAQSFAIRAVANAVRVGVLPRLKDSAIICVDCRKRTAAVYEHRDYAKPLTVEPVCQLCNCRRGPALWSISDHKDAIATAEKVSAESGAA
jgi:hypothetical protein